ncbi:nucleoside phosphorylase [Candidatus Uabimicrobium amorphum]|uniref:Uridine phosphorylase n=1 Tax=Uabimicrobium amorphum TaxID=2596890 RepID=A0A5S9IPS8_UABAM|nr:nucleoside phosphorylase [Candidatus Uabimicrobium amorphum]BBM85450.1 uridine phosphorylase [Candidatus Uabimicrobium amorphum]
MENEKGQIQSAEIVKTETGRQYHVNLAPGEVAPYIMLCGDPARAKRVSQLFDEVELTRQNREYISFTGKYKNMPVTVMGTGIGCGNMEIAVIELLQCVDNPVIIRVGSCGTLQEDIELGDLIITTGSVRLENVSTYFVPEGYPALAHIDTIWALQKACAEQNFRHHSGLTACSPGFYGGQGRHVPGFPPRKPHLLDELGKLKVKNFEMETSVLLTMSHLGGARAGTVCAAYANRTKNTFISPEDKDSAEMNCILAGLGALLELHKTDQIRKEKNNEQWYPWLT